MTLMFLLELKHASELFLVLFASWLRVEDAFMFTLSNIVILSFAWIWTVLTQSILSCSFAEMFRLV